MAGETKTNPVTTLKRLFTPFLEGVSRTRAPDDAAHQSIYESVAKVTAAMKERERLRDLERAETEKLDGLRDQLEEKDGERIRALTEYRVSAAKEANDHAQSLLKECADIRQEIDDARAVAGGIKARVEALNEELKTLARSYRLDLGAFLSTVYAGLIDRYNEAAPGVAEIVLQLAAVRRVMRTYTAGSDAGWSGQVLFPGMRAGENTAIEPMLDGGSLAFDREATARTSRIVDEMRAAGFIYRLD